MLVRTIIMFKILYSKLHLCKSNLLELEIKLIKSWYTPYIRPYKIKSYNSTRQILKPFQKFL